MFITLYYKIIKFTYLKKTEKSIFLLNLSEKNGTFFYKCRDEQVKYWGRYKVVKVKYENSVRTMPYKPDYSGSWTLQFSSKIADNTVVKLQADTANSYHKQNILIKSELNQITKINSMENVTQELYWSCLYIITLFSFYYTVIISKALDLNWFTVY